MNIKIGDRVKLLKKYNQFHLNEYISDSSKFSYNHVFLFDSPKLHAPGVIYNYEEEIYKIDTIQGKKIAYTQLLIIDLKGALTKGEIKINQSKLDNKKSGKFYKDFLTQLKCNLENLTMGLTTMEETISSAIWVFQDYYKKKFGQEISALDAIETNRIKQLDDEQYFKETWKRFLPQETPLIIEKEFKEMKLSWHFNTSVRIDWVDKFITHAIKNEVHKTTKIARYFSGIYLTRNRNNSQNWYYREYINIQKDFTSKNDAELCVKWQDKDCKIITFTTETLWENTQFKLALKKLVNSPIY